MYKYTYLLRDLTKDSSLSELLEVGGMKSSDSSNKSLQLLLDENGIIIVIITPHEQLKLHCTH